jgi:hypothetical protein
LLDSDDDDEVEVPDELEAPPLDEPPLEAPPFEEALPLVFADEPSEEPPLSEEAAPFRA